MADLAVDVKNVVRFLIRLASGSGDPDDTMVTWVVDDGDGLKDVPDRSLDRMAIAIGSNGQTAPPSERSLATCRSKLEPHGWLWLGHHNLPGLGSTSYWKNAWRSAGSGYRRSLAAAGFPHVTSFAFSERGTSTKSCLWVVPLETATCVPCAGPALGIVVPWKQRLAQRPWFWKYCVPNRGYLAASATDVPVWLREIEDHVECYYTTRWRISVWHRSGGRMAIRDVFFPVGTTHDDIRGFWRVRENVPREHRRGLGLEEYVLTDRGGMLWIDRPFLQSDVVGPRRQPRQCSYEDVVDFVRRLHEVPAIDGSQALSLADVVRRITAGQGGGSQASGSELERLRALASDVSGGVSGRPVLQHGDMVERNVLATADGVKAFDWWAATWVNYPGHDAVSFHYAERRASGTTAELVRELVRRLADEDSDPRLEHTLATVRADIDWRAATLTYLVTLLAAGLRNEAAGGWTSAVVAPALDALESTAIVRELTSQARVGPGADRV